MAKYPFTKSCEHCSTSFTVFRASSRNKRFCSSTCFYSHKTVRQRLPNCLNCDKVLRGDQTKFCSRSCAAHVNNKTRRPLTEEQRRKRSLSMQGTTRDVESIVKALITKGHKVSFLLPNRLCPVCNEDTGSYKRKCCSPACVKQHLKQLSQSNPKCGGQKHTHRSQIINIAGETFTSESSFEVKVAQILNELQILWIRPSYVWYIDSDNKKRRYYPDFFLPDHNLYLDPKNDYLIQTDIDKIKRARDYNDIRIVILSEQQITKDLIQQLVGLP